MENNFIGTLRMDDKGNRITLMKKNPLCARCMKNLTRGEIVYLCSLSKKVYCAKCEKGKEYWSCDNPSRIDEHIDWFSILEIEKEVVLWRR